MEIYEEGPHYPPGAPPLLPIKKKFFINWPIFMKFET